MTKCPHAVPDPSILMRSSGSRTSGPYCGHEQSVVVRADRVQQATTVIREDRGLLQRHRVYMLPQPLSSSLDGMIET